MKIFKFYVSLYKEEKWLNKMSSLGWELTSKNTQYEFNKTFSNSIVKIDCRNFKSKEDFQNYISFFNDCGWEHISGTHTSGKQYFKKIDDNAGDDIFSDVSSNAERYKRLSNMWLSLVACYIPIFTALVMTKAINITSLLNPKSLYYTPELWEKTGVSFWKAFLFETPFALMRGYAWLIFPILIIVYTIFALKAQIYYKKANLENKI